MQTQPIDFTNCKDGFRKYGGSDSKDSIIYEGSPYMIKYTEKRAAKNDLQTSYVNNVLSEYLGSNIIQSLGIPTHETLLGTYNNDLVVACKDFRQVDEELHEFTWYMLNMYESSQIGRIPTYHQIYDVINHNPKLSTIKKEALDRYWDTFVADALIGNFDRHKDNFGYLVSPSSGTIRLAPVYDCGSSLYPGLSSEGMSKVLANDDEIQTRMYEFPKAALNLSDDIKHEYKASYYKVLSSNADKNCSAALLRIYPKIDMNKIHNIINSAPYIPNNKKDFYNTIIECRKTMILDPAYERVLEKQKHDKNIENIYNASKDGNMILDPTLIDSIKLPGED